MLCPDHTDSPRGKVRRVENVRGRGEERALPPAASQALAGMSAAGAWPRACPESSPPTPTPGELPWLWRDMDLKTLLWERRRGPKVKVYLNGSPAAPADRRLPLVPTLSVLSASKTEVEANTAAERSE